MNRLEIIQSVYGTDYVFQAAELEKLYQVIEATAKEACNVLYENVEVALDAVGGVVYPEGLLIEHFGLEGE